MLKHITWARLGLVFLALNTSPIPAMADSSVSDRFMTLSRAATWTEAPSITLQFATHHPQGMVRIGDTYYISSVEITRRPSRYETVKDGYDRDTGEGRGHLFKVSADGKLLEDIILGEGAMYHPGGIDFDGTYLWVPVAEYRPNSASLLYRIDIRTMTPKIVHRFKDHIGGLVLDKDTKILHGVSWGSRRFYAWPLDSKGYVKNADADPQKIRTHNPSHYIDYQDCHFVGSSTMLCAGLNNYKTSAEATPFPLGGMELVNLKDNRPLWQLPVEKWSPSGLPMTQNPFFVEGRQNGIRAYFAPDDDKTTIFIFDITPAP